MNGKEHSFKLGKPIKKIFSEGETLPTNMFLRKDDKWYEIDLNKAYSGTLEPGLMNIFKEKFLNKFKEQE